MSSLPNLPRHVVLIDFGSTYTKVAVVDMRHKKLVHQTQFPSTVATDARIGLAQCFDAATLAIGTVPFEQALKLATSSAAGGLRMGVVGISPSLSIAAGRNAAFGAGAKILHTCSGRLEVHDIAQLLASPIEILLFCGGYEGGSSEVLLHNAELLAAAPSHIPIIFAGNSAVAPDIRRIFTLAGKEFYVVPNIIPAVGELDKVPTESVIRDIFLKRIVNMKNLDSVATMLDKMVMPTPASVLRAGHLLSKGCGRHKGWGPTMLVDIGGATTDIHSYIAQTAHEGAKILGAESYEKRTVEGDLGMRESSNSLLQEIGPEKMSGETGLAVEKIQAVIEKWLVHHDCIATKEDEKKVDSALAKGAASIAARRHAGQIERVSSAGIKTIQRGKNLREVATVIGTGGPVIYHHNPQLALSGVLRTGDKEADVLLPEHANFFIDSNYTFYAAGLLMEVDEEAAFILMQESLRAL